MAREAGAGSLNEGGIGALRPTCEACQTCALAHGEPPFEDGPLKGYCIAYSRASGRRKPGPVMYDGAPCGLRQEP